MELIIWIAIAIFVAAYRMNTGDNVYQLIHHREITEDFDVFWFEPDGDIQFAVEFYNGGTCLEEVMEDGVKRLVK